MSDTQILNNLVEKLNTRLQKINTVIFTCEMNGNYNGQLDSEKQLITELLNDISEVK